MPDDPTWPSDRSERAQAMVAAGLIGGARPGAGRPRVPRATALAAEAAVEHADELVDALRSAIAPDQPPEQRSRSAARWLQAAQREHDHELRREEVEAEHDDFDDLGRSELLALLLPLLVEGTENGTLPSPLDVVDADAVEVEL